MKRLPQAKKNQLIGVLVATLILISLVYFMLISPQKDKNIALLNSISKEQAKRKDFEATVKQMSATTNKLAELNHQLAQVEADCASGDLYTWTLDTINGFKSGYKVVPTLGQPTLGDCDLISGTPYKQIRFTMNGTAYFHDLGKFIADFENKFPHCRVVNLDISAAQATSEQLSFKMDITAPVKPNN